MKFREAYNHVDHFRRKLKNIWAECYAQAGKEVGGNWQDAEVMRRRRARADELADEQMKGTEVRVHWGPEKKHG